MIPPLLIVLILSILASATTRAQAPDGKQGAAPTTVPSEPKPSTAATLNDYIVRAKAKEASGDLAGALAVYDEAFSSLTDEYERTRRGKTDPELLTIFKRMLSESDRLVERFETPEFEAAVPERDMLSVSERHLWGKSVGVNLVFEDPGVLLTGVESSDKKLTGVVDLGMTPATPWHDLVMRLSFTIVSGELELFLRYWPGRVPFSIKLNRSTGFELNKPYDVTFRIKGRKIEMIVPDAPPVVDTFARSTSRAGGVGFAMNPGSKVILSACKVKLLRTSVASTPRPTSRSK